MRILHAAESVKGGVATVLNALIADQAARAHISHLAVLCPESQRAEIVVPPAAHVSVHGFRGEGRLARIVFLYLALLRCYFSLRPDVVHLHSTFAGLVFRLLVPFRRRTRVIYQPHGVAFDPHRVASRIKRVVFVAIERVLLLRTHAVLAISAYEHEQLLQAGFARTGLRLIENGVADVSGVALAPAARTGFVFVGRLDEQKGADRLFRFWQQHSHGEVLTLVGSSVVGAPCFAPEESATIHFAGWCAPATVAGFMGAARAVIVPSQWEGFGLVVPEAFRAGTPVICSNRGALPDLVTSGVNGYVFDFDDFDASLREALMMFDQADFAALSQSARATYEQRFHVGLMCQKVYETYLEPA